MNNQNTIFSTILLVLGCVVLSPVTQAKQPSEDRGNGNSAAENVDALNLSTSGSNNTGHGWFSLFSNTSGSSNTADGFQALYSNTTGVENTANGALALFSNTEGNSNTAAGDQALFSNTIGAANTANGFFALLSNTEGNSNTAIGDVALANNTTGSFNTAIGVGAGTGIETASNVICIGHPGQNLSNRCYIGNIREAFVSGDAVPVLIDSTGQLGTAVSSRRFKKEIKPMDKASEAVLALKPVAFHYKNDTTNTPQFGLIAEEVAQVNPDLVVHDKNGEISTVRYDAVNAMLLNEFLKEHKAFLKEQRKVEEQGAIIAKQQKQIEALTAGLQKVSDQLELSKPAPQVVANK
jgi:Chaperone of endosialidase